jgi:hypothetical protein
MLYEHRDESMNEWNQHFRLSTNTLVITYKKSVQQTVVASIVLTPKQPSFTKEMFSRPLLQTPIQLVSSSHPKVGAGHGITKQQKRDLLR